MLGNYTVLINLPLYLLLLFRSKITKYKIGNFIVKIQQ